MRKLTIIFYMFGLALTSVESALGQSLPVGSPVLNDYYRRQQLLGKVDSDLSFSVLPLLSSKQLKVSNIFNPDTFKKSSRWSQLAPYTFSNKSGAIQILPISWQQQYNSDHPYGWNDGPMIPTKGYQTMISGGIYFRYGPLSIQLRPEYVYAANPIFNGFASGHTGQDLVNYYGLYNDIDNPERFGNSYYSKLFWGQSSMRLTLGVISVGVSNENLWWGPGIQNALILSNNAPGFKHLTFNTTKPVPTAIGSFEWEFIAGHLDDSGYPPLLTTTLADGTNLFVYKNTDWRYFTGFNLNYHPKWIRGFTLGFNRTFNAYYSDVKTHGFSAFVPYLTSFFKKNYNNGAGDAYPMDQVTSVYARWFFVKAQAEFYIEYGLEDNTYNLNDFLGSPDHSRAYTVGLRKILPIAGKKDQHILIGAEITQTSLTPVDIGVREAGLWYFNYQVTQGHTNNGQILGAGTGPGGNEQSIDVSWVKGLKRLGIQFQRFEHDVDYTDIYLSPINGNSRSWVDFGVGLVGEWNYKNLLFNAKLQEIQSLNYEWILKNYNPSQYYIPNNTVYNLHAELGMTYRF